MDTLIIVEDIIVVSDSTFQQYQLETTNLKYNSLIDQLASRSSLFIKNYGPSSIATLSHRGGNASQTEVTWNNVPIGNPMLGLSDLSLINGFFLNQVELRSDSKTLSALTGSLDLSSNVSPQNKLSIHNGIGSFGFIEHGLRGELSLESLSFNLSLLSTRANNNFPYLLTNGKEEFTTNANYKQNGAMLLVKYKIGKQSHLKFSSWWLNTFRKIPKITTQNKNISNQADESWRNVFTYSNVYKNTKIETTIAYNKESILYNDEAINLSSPSEFKTIFGNLQLEHYSKIGKTSFKAQNQHIISKTDGYDQQRLYNLTRADIEQSYVYKHKTISGSIGIAKTSIIGPQFIGEFSTTIPLSRKIKLQAEFGNEIRFPTSNDLYWSLGGNPSLKPERALKYEISSQFKSKNLWISTTYYNRNVKDWILWSAIQNSYFEVFNIARVLSYGLEAEIKNTINIDKRTSVNWYTNTNIGRSTNKVAIALPKINPGDQLYYTPSIQNASGIEFIFYNLSANFSNQYTSSTNGIKARIDDYAIQNVALNYKYMAKRFAAEFALQINNITNTQYRVIESRPMPGRNYKLFINIQL